MQIDHTDVHGGNKMMDDSVCAYFALLLVQHSGETHTHGKPLGLHGPRTEPGRRLERITGLTLSCRCRLCASTCFDTEAVMAGLYSPQGRAGVAASCESEAETKPLSSVTRRKVQNCTKTERRAQEVSLSQTGE